MKWMLFSKSIVGDFPQNSSLVIPISISSLIDQIGSYWSTTIQQNILKSRQKQ